MLFISCDAIHNAVQFLEIESLLTQEQIVVILFERLKYKLPGGRKLNKRKKDLACKYFGIDEDFYWLEISEEHA